MRAISAPVAISAAAPVASKRTPAGILVPALMAVFADGIAVSTAAPQRTEVPRSVVCCRISVGQRAVLWVQPSCHPGLPCVSGSCSRTDALRVTASARAACSVASKEDALDRTSISLTHCPIAGAAIASTHALNVKAISSSMSVRPRDNVGG